MRLIYFRNCIILNLAHLIHTLVLLLFLSVMLIVLLGVLIRLCVSLHPYSGQNKPPMYGDYEAQRHWMEITYNLPVREWYFNTTDNDLLYWGLDYPPLTAYHSWLCGYVAGKVNSSYIELYHSRGLESTSHKYFMRFSVLVADFITFIPALFLFYLQNKNLCLHKAKEYSVSANEAKKLCSLLALIYPGIIIIDHGHFQYNCISLGLFVFAVSAIMEGRHYISSVLFCCAILYKQMELYHALPFFFYLLGDCMMIFKRQGFLKALYKLVCLIGVVISTFTIINLPFLTEVDQIAQLIIRLFPIARGVFEDKVANFWCLVNTVFKLKVLLTNESMAKICVLFTFLSVIPTSYDLFFKNTYIKFKYSLINSALSFFLFSYQVHEKSILLVAVPVLLVLPYDPLPCVWFLCISVFSMFPLVFKDHLLVPYFALCLLFILTFISSSFNRTVKLSEHTVTKNQFFIFQILNFNVNYLYYLSLFGCLILSISMITIKPPVKYPDVFPLIISVYCCVHFLAFLLYFNIKQWTSRELKGKHD